MPHCAAINCTNKSSSKSRAQLELEKHHKITFHSFPKNSHKREIWINRMGLTEVSLPKYPHLCSCHFSSESFDRTSAWKIRLQDDAVPTIRKAYDVSNTAINQEAVVPQEIYNINTDTETIKLAKDYGNTKDASSQTPLQPRSADKATWVSKSLIANSLTKMRLRNIIKHQKDVYQRQVKVLKQATRRKEKSIALLKNALTEIMKRKQLTDVELDILRNIGLSTKNFLRVEKMPKHTVLP